MSVINQMLNQLEQRGEQPSAEQTMVRAVPQARRSLAVPLLVFALAVVAAIAIGLWAQTRKPEVVAENNTAKAVQAFPHPEGTGNPSGSNELEKLPMQHQPVAPIAASPVAPAASLPASRLSFELSSVPLPSTIRSLGKVPAEHALIVATSISAEKNEAPPQPAEPPPMQTVTENTKIAQQTSSGTSPMKHVSPAQQADAEFRKAVALMQQGRIADALAGYESALRLNAGHDEARQALVALLLESKRGTEAERVLQERLESKPEHTGFTMLLARLQVERGAVDEATATLEKGLPYASAQPDYQAFLAALLQRQNRNDDAIAHYQIALQAAPNNGIWLMGYGISLQAMQRNADAKDAFKRALDTQTLTPDLQAFVQQKLKGL